jgi:hypothetical protein
MRRELGEIGMIGCGAVKARVRPPAIVEVEAAANRCARLRHTAVGSEIHLPYLTLRHSRSTKTLSRQAPLPSMLMAIAFLIRTSVNAVPVN